MTSPSRDSPGKQAQILTAAARLFAEKGFDGTTLAMVGTASGAAVGSIAHYFGDKPGLAAAVYADVARDLVARTVAALNRHGTDMTAAIRALLRACYAWAAERPYGPRALAVLAAPVCTQPPHSTALLESRLAAALATWAAPLVAANVMVPRTPAQLYALLVAPALHVILAAADPLNADDPSTAVWIGVLTAAALAGLRASGPPAPEMRRPARQATRNPAGGRAPVDGGDLFDRQDQT